MASTRKRTLEDEIQSIYTSFIECVSEGTPGSSSSRSTCLESVLAKLEDFRKNNKGTFPEKVNTLTELIRTRIHNLESAELKLHKEGDFEKQFIELGVRYVKAPQRNFKDVQGLEKIKKLLRTNVIYPLQFGELSKEFGIRTSGGILFYGPPGNGKTYLAESLAGEAGISFLELNPAFLYNEFFGKFEKNISEIFRLAKETAPNILFFDEVETLIPKREQADHSVVKRGVTQLLIEINKLLNDEKGKTYLVAATNLPWTIDPAMLRPGRFDLKVYIPLPGKADREAFIRSRLQSTAFSKDIKTSEIAELTEGFSVSDIDFIMRQSSENVFYEAVEYGKKRKITKEDIIDCISKIKPSSNEGLIKKYNQFN